MTFGAPGKEGARVHDIKDVEEILDAFRSHGHTEVSVPKRQYIKHRIKDADYVMWIRLTLLEYMPEERVKNTLGRSI